MPNWCSTTYKCVGDPKTVSSLHKILKKMSHRKNPKHKNGFGTLWLGELLIDLGFDWEKYRCRGEIIDFYMQGELLVINQETAWCEQEGVREAIEQKYPGMKVYYLEEEPGCEVYATNDLTGDIFPDNFYLDSYDDPQYFETIEEASKYVSDLVGHEVEASVTAIQRALDDYTEIRQENDEDVFYSFHQYQRVED